MVHHHTHITQSPQETQNLGQELAASIKRGESPGVLYLHGDLGSGKTTFVQGFARGLGLTHARLLSPTFIIVRRYQLPDSGIFFHHIDLYRTNDESQLTTLGLDEIFADPQNYVAVEWPERLETHTAKVHRDIWFRALPDGTHEVKYD